MKVFSHKFTFVGNLNQEKYTDLTMTTNEVEGIEGKVVHAHKVVMAAVSEKFERICDRQIEGGVEVIRNMKFVVLEKIVNFVYTGIVEVEEGDEEEDFHDGLDMMNIELVGERKHENLPQLSNTTGFGSQVKSTEKVSVDVKKTSFDVTNPIHELNFPLNKVCVLNEERKRVENFGKQNIQIRNIKVQCEYCDSKTSMGNYSRHCKNQHPDAWFSNRVLQHCDYCKSEVPRYKFQIHQKYVHGRGQIESHIPARKVSVPNKKEMKIEKVGIGNLKVQCEFCELKVKLHNYTRHCKFKHPDIWSSNQGFQYCVNCSRRVSQLCFQLHQKHRHGREQIESAPAQQKAGLIARKKGQKKVKCDFCPASFTSYDNYPRHCQTWHSSEVSASLSKVSCQQCNSKVHQLNLKNHLRVVHGKDVQELNNNLPDGAEQHRVMIKLRIEFDTNRVITMACRQGRLTHKFMLKVSKMYKIEMKDLQFEADGQLITGQERVELLAHKCIEVSMSGRAKRYSVRQEKEASCLDEEDPEEKQVEESRKRKIDQCTRNPGWSTIQMGGDAEEECMDKNINNEKGDENFSGKS